MVAGSLADAGQHDRAERVARSVPDPDQRARAMAQLAMVLTAAGGTVAARRITAAAPVNGEWQIAAAPALTLSESAWEWIKPAL